MTQTTWRSELISALYTNGETWESLVAVVCEDLDKHFDSGWGGPKGCPFTAWTKDFVYFPACYDGSEWVASVARNPNGQPTNHIGGG